MVGGVSVLVCAFGKVWTVHMNANRVCFQRLLVLDFVPLVSP